jgi:hypothetical protein
LIAVQSTINKHLSPAPPIWDTEWGFSSTDYSTPAGNGADPTARFIQSSKVAERILTACAAGSPIYIYYDLQDGGTDPTIRLDNFGLIANDYSSKPALSAVKALASVARNRTYAGLIHTAPSSLVVMRFDGANDQVFAVWSFIPNSEVTVTLPTNATVTDHYGHPLSPPVLGNRLAVTVQESTGPVYITIASAQSAPTPTPPPASPVSNPPPNAGGSGGGGAPSLWFDGALGMLVAVRRFTRRHCWWQKAEKLKQTR